MDPEPTAQDAPPAPSDSNQHSHPQDEYSRTRKGKFRFKTSSSKSQSRRRSRHHDRGSDYTDSHRHSRKRPRHHHDRDHHHSHNRRSKRHRPKRSSPDPDIDEQQPGDGGGGVSPNTAFRESLFDALADDEGADYWQTIYGQPIHTYANPSVPRGPAGELEQMTEDEYAAYVRTRMWERTREGMIEMQERERAERRERERRERKYDEGVRERVRFEKAVEESLARGEGRRKGRVWREAGREYLGRWERLLRGDDNGPEGEGEGKSLAEMIFWPVQSGRRRDVSRDAVEQFMRHALVPLSGSGSEIDKDALLPGVLKAERVRWHPDKIQHRHGALGVDQDVMSSVTEVFQIIDLMWNEVKEKQR